MAIHTTSVLIDADAQKVFEALTQPELVSLWQFGRRVQSDWQAGHAIKFIAESEGKVLEQWGTILEMRTNELIKYNLFTPTPGIEDKIENYNVTSYILSTDNGQTKVELIQEDNRPFGFTPATLKPILVALKKVVEGN
ncbi:ATPase [Niastella caeni]|uniref:ATPase n=1 Tax=Niastella caeni TaxID=2569763 RepID=A0A4S8I137_9BACT|nr:SRPBCC domain-containing protein [Niastella caeni]THU39382.1 ATPase [Niastella caeni]